MKTIAIISGDIINSSDLDKQSKEKLIEVMKNSVNNPLEIYQGDSFQFMASFPSDSFVEALRLKLSLNTYQKDKPASYWDARIAIGIGPVEHPKAKLLESDGTAFRISGRLLAGINKQNVIAIGTTDTNFNEEIHVAMEFVNHLISGLTFAQKEVILEALNGKTQDEISESLGVNQSTVNRHLKAGNYRLIKVFDKRYRQIIAKISAS